MFKQVLVIIAIAALVSSNEFLSTFDFELQLPKDAPERLDDVVVYAFEGFKLKFGKEYDAEEHEYRLRVFNDNLKFINDFNKEEHTFTLGITPFTDLTNAEFKA